MKVEWDVQDLKVCIQTQVINTRLPKKRYLAKDGANWINETDPTGKITFSTRIRVTPMFQTADDLWYDLLPRHIHMFRGTKEEVDQRVSLIEMIWRSRGNAVMFLDDDDTHIKRIANLRVNCPENMKVEILLEGDSNPGPSTNLHDIEDGVFDISNPVSLAMVQHTFPTLFANTIGGVQAMSAPVGLAYAMRVVYNDGEAPRDKFPTYTTFRDAPSHIKIIRPKTKHGSVVDVRQYGKEVLTYGIQVSPVQYVLTEDSFINLRFPVKELRCAQPKDVSRMVDLQEMFNLQQCIG